MKCLINTNLVYILPTRVIVVMRTQKTIWICWNGFREYGSWKFGVMPAGGGRPGLWGLGMGLWDDGMVEGVERDAASSGCC